MDILIAQGKVNLTGANVTNVERAVVSGGGTLDMRSAPQGPHTIVSKSTEGTSATIYGPDGGTHIHAGEGDDYIYGGKGNNHLFAGSGFDIFAETGTRNVVYNADLPKLELDFRGTTPDSSDGFFYYSPAHIGGDVYGVVKPFSNSLDEFLVKGCNGQQLMSVTILYEQPA